MDRWLQSLAIPALAVGLLYFGRPILVPLAVAVLLAVVLSPGVKRLEQISLGSFALGRIPAVLVASAAVAAVFLGVIWLLTTQGREILGDLPEYRRAVVARLEELRKPIDSLERVASEMKAAAGMAEPPGAARVAVVDPSSALLGQITGWAGSLLSLLASAGLIVVLLVFLLIESEDLRNRLIRVAGQSNIRLATLTFDDAAARMTRYVRALSLLNLGHGLAVGLVLWSLGLPGALLFGLLAALLRFVPYVGPWTAALLPIALSIAVFDNWTMPLLVAALLAAIELLSNNVLEPVLLGPSVGLSPFGVILAAIFWAWLWGPIGLVLATPLTVGLVVLGRHVPRLEGLAILLSDAEPLGPAERFYQRLLMHDIEDAIDLVEGHAGKTGLVSAWDEIVLPALCLIDRDQQTRSVDDDEVERAREVVEILLFEIADTERVPASSMPPIECVPVRTWGDEIACRALAGFLRAAGIPARARERVPTGSAVERVAEDAPKVICVWSLDPMGRGDLRHLVARLRKRAPRTAIVVGTCGGKPWHQAAPASDPGVHVVGSFSAASERLVELLGMDAPAVCTSSPLLEEGKAKHA